MRVETLGVFAFILFCGIGGLGAMYYYCVRIVEEGFVGVVYHFGALQNQIINPGLAFHFPPVRSVIPIQITVQTDAVNNVECGTNSGVKMLFTKIEVVNQLPRSSVYEVVKNYTKDYDQHLIYNRIESLMMQFCSKRSVDEVYIKNFDTLDEFLVEELRKSMDEKGVNLKIIDVRFLKPQIPRELQAKYDEMQNTESDKQHKLKKHELAMQVRNQTAAEELNQINHEKLKVLADIEAENKKALARTMTKHEQEIAIIAAEGIRMRETIRMDLANAEARTRSQIELDELEYERNHTLLKYKRSLVLFDADIRSEVGKIDADTQLYWDNSTAAGRELLLTAAYLKLESAKSIANNSKIYYGEKLPNLVWGWNEKI